MAVKSSDNGSRIDSVTGQQYGIHEHYSMCMCVKFVLNPEDSHVI